MANNKNKYIELIIIFLLYAIAYLIGFILSVSKNYILEMVILLLSISTFAIWLFMVLSDISKLHYLYWPLTPLVISTILFIVYENKNFFVILYYIIVAIWSLLLVFNYILNYQNENLENKKLQKIKDNKNRSLSYILDLGKYYLIALLNFLLLIPLVESFRLKNFNGIILIGTIVSIIGIIIETISNIQAYNFNKNKKIQHDFCDIGLWKFSRHPNYLGELIFWIGISLSFVLSNLRFWYYSLGVLGVIILTLTLLIPKLEKKQASNKLFLEYKNKTAKLLLFSKINKNREKSESK